MTISAIPTRYAGVQFRSRLEARWAAFFDLVAWQWEYEPTDLDGYIPDFFLRFFEPVLVEVKPFFLRPYEHEAEDLASEARKRIGALGDRFEQTHQILLGAVFYPQFFGFGVQSRWLDPVQCRVLGRGISSSPVRRAYHGVVRAIRCAFCQRPSMCLDFDPVVEDYEVALASQCFVCGAAAVDGPVGEPWDPTAAWREAGNRVQWRGSP